MSRGRFGDAPLSSATPSSQAGTADAPGGEPRSRNVLLVVGSILFALVAVEIVFRLAMGLPVFKFVNWRTEEVTVDNLGERALFDPVLGWVLRDNYRSDGFNTLDHGIRRNFSETTIRTGALLAVGDSFTEGWDEVRDNETWPAHLESMIGKPVVNGANGGFGTDQIILRIEQLLPIVRPKTLLIGFHELDILKAAYSAWGVSKPYFTIEGGALRYHPPQPLEPYKTAGWSGAVKRSVRNVLGYSAVANHLFGRLAYFYWYGPEQQLVTRVHTDDVAVEITCKLLTRVKTKADGAGIRTLLFLQYYAPAIFDPQSAFSQKVMACARAIGIKVVDHYPALHAIIEKDRRGLMPYYVMNGTFFGHMSSLGNRHAAELLAAALREP